MILPRITSELPGSSGRIKACAEDFRVDEIPAYLPSGQGPHLYLKVEKRSRTTRDIARTLSRALAVPERDVGYAGLKDREAVTTQWLSFPTPRDPDPASLAGEGYRILEASRHANKLRPGHSRGNRFSVVVRGGDLTRATACAQALAERGFPNFFGSQRFGVEGKNAAVGRLLIQGRTDDPEARRALRDRFLRRLVLSAFQSHLFNRWLAERIADGLFATVIEGDALKKLDTGGVFVSDDPATDQPRIERFEISPAGPMFGSKLLAASGEAHAREERLLAAEGMHLSDFVRGGGETLGTRRAARLPVHVELDPHPDGYRASFELPKGSYATVVVGELTQSEVELGELED